MSNQTTPIETKHTDLSLASNDDDDNSQRPTVSGAGSSLYKFDPVNQRQDSQYFDTESIGRSTLALNASDEANINETKTKPPPKPISRDGTNTTSKNKEKEVVIIRSMSMLKSQKRKARRKKHVRRELNKEERHHLHAKELELFMNAENEIFQHVYLSQTKKKVLAFFESSPTEIVMVLLTVFALYGSDVADAHFSMETDLTIDILIWVVMFLFLIENYALARVKKGYCCSKSMVLELIAALSMLFDIKSLGLIEYIENVLEDGTAARAGRAARAGTRAGRLSKLMKMLRLMRVLSLFLQLMKISNDRSKTHRVTDVDLFGSEHEKEIIAQGHRRPNKANVAVPEDEEPEDEAGAMSRSLSQTMTIDAIILIIVLLFASAIVNIDGQNTYRYEVNVLQQIETLAFSTGTDSINVTEACHSYTTSFQDPYLQEKYPNMQNCLYLKVRHKIHVNEQDVLLTLRTRGERKDVDVSAGTYAVFDNRAKFKSLAEQSYWTTTVVIVVILAMILKFKDTSDRVTKSINTPLLNLCDDMLLVSDMDLEGPIMHFPSKINEIRNAQLAFLRMKHALSSFGKYVPHEVVREMIARGEDAELGMERKKITIFFSDIAGFTTICELMEPQNLLILLSEYFDSMQKIIGAKDSRGTLLEFIGDALLVVWNAPQDVPYHASKCVEASIKMHEFLHDAEERWTEQKYPLVKIRIGINTCKVFVGNLGSPVRMKYGVLGDGVNLASRLEELNKRYNSKILLSDSTYEDAKVQSLFTLRQLDQVAVKGKKEGTKIYECIGRAVDTSNEEKLLCIKMQNSFHLYYDRKFSEAEISFESVQRKFQELRGYEDAASRLLAKRCARFAENPPEKDWLGTEVLDKKHF